MLGAFGYKIGRKLRLMNVNCDANILWQILVREIYVLMKHYGSIDILRDKCKSLIKAKKTPTPEAIEACKMFADLYITPTHAHDWTYLTRYCQHSFINVLESGYFLNNGQELGMIFVLDFNTNTVNFYGNNFENKITKYQSNTIDELMEFEDMPTKTLLEITTEMKERFLLYTEKVEKINDEINNINTIINKNREMGDGQNILEKLIKLSSDAEFSKKQIYIEYRFLYNRLEALNLIDYS